MANDVRVAITGDNSDLLQALQVSNAQLAIFNKNATTSTSTVAASASKAAVNFGVLRGSMTALAASALQTAPGVAQLSSVLGTMAIGAGPMVAILAGMAALGLAWRLLTKDARDLKAATKEAADEADRLIKKQEGPNVERARQQGLLGGDLTKVQAEIVKLEAQEKRLGVTVAALVDKRAEELRLQQRIAALGKEILATNTATREEAEKKAIAAEREAAALRGDARQASIVTRNLRSNASALAGMISSGGYIRDVDGSIRPSLGFIRPNVRAIQQGGGMSSHLAMQMDPRLRLPASSVQGTGSAIASGANASVWSRFGGGENAAMMAIQMAQGAASGGGLGALMGGAGSMAGMALGGPVGAAAGGFIGTQLANLLGSSKDREEEQYRAHARALREAAGQIFTVILNFPGGALYDTSNPDFQEAIVETIEAATGNRNGRVQLVRG